VRKLTSSLLIVIIYILAAFSVVVALLYALSASASFAIIYNGLPIGFAPIDWKMKMKIFLELCCGIYGWISLAVLYKQSPLSYTEISNWVYAGLTLGTYAAINTQAPLVIKLAPIFLAGFLIILAVITATTKTELKTDAEKSSQ